MTAETVSSSVSNATVGISQTAPNSTSSASIITKNLKVQKKRNAVKPKIVSSHPAYSDMVKKAIIDLKDRKGSSKAAILKYIIQHYKLGDNVVKINAHLRQSLKRGVTTGTLNQVKGIGASGSFRLGENHTKTATKKKKLVGKKEIKKPIIKSPIKKANPTAKKLKVVEKVIAPTSAGHSAAPVVGKQTVTKKPARKAVTRKKSEAEKKVKLSVAKKAPTKSVKKSTTTKVKN